MQRLPLHVGRGSHQTSRSMWLQVIHLGQGRRGEGRIKCRVLSPSPGPPDAPTPVFRILLTPWVLDQGPWRTPRCLDSDSPPASRPSLRVPLPLQGLSPPASPGEMLPVIRVPTPKPPPPAVSPGSSPGPPGTLHFPGCGSVCVEFLQLPALGRCPVSSLRLLLLQGLQGSLPPPRHSMAKIQDVGPISGT